MSKHLAPTTRKLADWISSYLDYTSESEAPEQYHRWTALAVIAGALQRKVWFDFGYKKLYPNLYVVLVSRPGQSRKSAMVIGKDLLAQLPSVKLGPKSTSIQQLIARLSSAFSTFSIGGVIHQHCSMSIMSDEFGSLIQSNDIGKMITTLTDWFDCDPSWDNETKNAGIDVIKGTCLNLIGCTTPDWISSYMPISSIGGGFTSRIVFVYADGIRKPIAYPTLSAKQKLLAVELVSDLRYVNSLVGEMSETSDAHEWMKHWYEQIHCKEPPLVLDKRFLPYYSRKQLHIFKIAMCLAVARTGKLLIQTEHYKQALQFLEEAEPGFPKAFGGMGKSSIANIIHDISDFIETRNSVNKQDIMIAHYRDGTPQDIDMALAALESMGKVKITRNVGGQYAYKWRSK